MGAMPTVDGLLASTPVPQHSRQAIIRRIFNVELTNDNIGSIDRLGAFFDWYEEQSEAAAGQVSVLTHEEVLDIIALLQAKDLSRSDISTRLQYHDCKSSDVGAINASIDLAARLWLTLSIGSLQRSLTPGSTIDWNHGKLADTLIDLLSPNFRLSDSVKFPKAFNAANLEKIVGIEVVWTSNLADHLCLREDDTKVMLYHQASFLELHECSNNSVLPSDLIQKTLRTLALLIPSVDKKSKVWFQKKQSNLSLDPKAGTYGPLNAAKRQINNFTYWRDRLVILKQTFDESEPHSLSLSWYNDRKKVQWYTFWIAAMILFLTILFGLIQSVASIVQAWAAMRVLPS